VEFYGALSDVELAGNFLVRKIFEERIENFLFAAAEVGDRVSLQAARLIRKNGIHEAGKNGTRNPEATVGDKWQGSNELFACFFVSENSLNTQAQQRKVVGILMLIADNDEARIRVAFEKIRQKGSSGLAGGMCVNDVNLRFRRFEIAKVRGKG